MICEDRICASGVHSVPWLLKSLQLDHSCCNKNGKNVLVWILLFAVDYTTKTLETWITSDRNRLAHQTWASVPFTRASYFLVHVFKPGVIFKLCKHQIMPRMHNLETWTTFEIDLLDKLGHHWLSTSQLLLSIASLDLISSSTDTRLCKEYIGDLDNFRIDLLIKFGHRWLLHKPATS